MTIDYQTFATEIIELTLAVGDNKLDAQQAIGRLEASGTSHCQLTGITDKWQITQETNRVLKILYPSYSHLFEDETLRAPSGNDEIPLQQSIKILVRQVLSGVQTLDTNQMQQRGAEKMLSMLPTPEQSSTPYVDHKEFRNLMHPPNDEQ